MKVLSLLVLFVTSVVGENDQENIINDNLDLLEGVGDADDPLNREHRQAVDNELKPFDIQSILYPFNTKPTEEATTEPSPYIVTSRSIVKVHSPTITGPVFVPSSSTTEKSQMKKENEAVSEDTFLNINDTPGITPESFLDHLTGKSANDKESQLQFEQLNSDEPVKIGTDISALTDLLQALGRQSGPVESRSSGENRNSRIFPDLLGAVFPQQHNNHYEHEEGRPFLDTVIEIGSAVINFKVEFFTKILPSILQSVFRVVSAVLQKQLIFLKIVDRISQQITYALNEQSYKLQHSLVQSNDNLEKTGDLVADTVNRAANTGGDIVVDTLNNINRIFGGFVRGGARFIEGLLEPLADPNGIRKVSKDVSATLGNTAETFGETAAQLINGFTGRGTAGSLFKTGAGIFRTLFRIAGGENPIGAVVSLFTGDENREAPRSIPSTPSKSSNRGFKPSEIYKMLRNQNERDDIPPEVPESIRNALNSPEFLAKLNEQINKNL